MCDRDAAGVPLLDIFVSAVSLLELSETCYPDLLDYAGSLYVGAAVWHINGRPLWVAHDRQLQLLERRRPAANPKLSDWTEDEVPFQIGVDAPIIFTRNLLKPLGWLMGYQGHEAYLDQFGANLPRGR